MTLQRWTLGTGLSQRSQCCNKADIVRLRTQPLPHRIILIAALSLTTFASADVAWAAEHPGRYLKKPDAWFSTGEAKQVVTNILSYQSELGGWPKKRRY